MTIPSAETYTADIFYNRRMLEQQNEQSKTRELGAGGRRRGGGGLELSLLYC